MIGLYDFLVTKTMAALAPRMGCEPGSPTYDKLWYGTYVFYINTAKSLVLIVLALLLGIFHYVAVFALAYSALRTYSFGVHLDNTLLCTMLGLVYYLGSTYLCLYIGIPTAVKAVLLLSCAVCFIVYAPAQTRKRPIPERRRHPLKVKAMCVFAVIILGVTILYPYPVYSDLLCMATVCQAVNILPITYKIFKES